MSYWPDVLGWWKYVRSVLHVLEQVENAGLPPIGWLLDFRIRILLCDLLNASCGENVGDDKKAVEISIETDYALDELENLGRRPMMYWPNVLGYQDYVESVLGVLEEAQNVGLPPMGRLLDHKIRIMLCNLLDANAGTKVGDEAKALKIMMEIDEALRELYENFL